MTLRLVENRAKRHDRERWRVCTIESVKTLRNDPNYQSSVGALGWIIHAGARASPIARTLTVHSDRSASTGPSRDACLAAGTTAKKAVSSRQPIGITMLNASVGAPRAATLSRPGQIEPTCHTDDNPDARHQCRVLTIEITNAPDLAPRAILIPISRVRRTTE